MTQAPLSVTLNATLTNRLEQFRAQGAPDAVLASAAKLLSWLNGQSAGVSATVSADGTLTIAAEFHQEVRVYVELETDGALGAAVTRDRRYARDLEAHTLADLTPEVILAAVRSIQGRVDLQVHPRG